MRLWRERRAWTEECRQDKTVVRYMRSFGADGSKEPWVKRRSIGGAGGPYRPPIQTSNETSNDESGSDQGEAWMYIGENRADWKVHELAWARSLETFEKGDSSSKRR